jgi:hypothetical protein
MYILKKDSFFLSLLGTKLHGCGVTMYAFFLSTVHINLFFRRPQTLQKKSITNPSTKMQIMKLYQAFSYGNILK